MEPFFGALGAVEITDFWETSDVVTGTVRYLPEADRMEFSSAPDDDAQEFRWEMTEGAVPGGGAYAVVCFLDDNSLVDQNRVIIPRAQLYGLFDAATPQSFSREDFEAILDEIAGVRVEMIEDGEAVDLFQIQS